MHPWDEFDGCKLQSKCAKSTIILYIQSEKISWKQIALWYCKYELSWFHENFVIPLYSTVWKSTKKRDQAKTKEFVKSTSLVKTLISRKKCWFFRKDHKSSFTVFFHFVLCAFLLTPLWQNFREINCKRNYYIFDLTGNSVSKLFRFPLFLSSEWADD